MCRCGLLPGSLAARTVEVDRYALASPLAHEFVGDGLILLIGVSTVRVLLIAESEISFLEGFCHHSWRGASVVEYASDLHKRGRTVDLSSVLCLRLLATPNFQGLGPEFDWRHSEKSIMCVAVSGHLGQLRQEPV